MVEREKVIAQLEKDVGKVVVVGFYKDETAPVDASDSRLVVRVPFEDSPEYIFVQSMKEYAIGGTMAMGQSFKPDEISVASSGSKYRYIVKGSPDNDIAHDPNHIKKLWHERPIDVEVLFL